MTTQTYSLDGKSWVDLGPTPCLLQNIGREAVAYVIGTAAPTAIDAGAHQLNPSGASSVVSIALTGQRVYARGVWTNVSKVAFSPGSTGAMTGDRYTTIATFVASGTAPIAAGKLVQTLAVTGIQAGDTIVATARTALPAGIAMLGEVSAPLAGKVTIAFQVAQLITSLVATPVAIDVLVLR